MKIITKAKRPQNQAVLLFKSRPSTDVSEQRLEWSINFSYNEKRQWSEYLYLYLDLFTDEPTAQLKARTHSVAIMCRLLRNKYGCSFPRIYKTLLKEIAKSGLDLHEDIINLKTKWDFIESLYEL